LCPTRRSSDLAAQHDVAQRSLGVVVVDRNSRVVEEHAESGLGVLAVLVQHVADGLGELAARQRGLAPTPRHELIDERLALLGADPRPGDQRGLVLFPRIGGYPRNLGSSDTLVDLEWAELRRSDVDPTATQE